MTNYCVMVPVRNGAKWLPEFLNGLAAQELAPLRTYFFLNNCTDRSKFIIKNYADRHSKVTIMEFNYKQDILQLAASDPYEYQALLCKVRNALIDTAIGQPGHNWTHALMHDVTKFSPPNLAKALLNLQKPIVSPLILRDGMGIFWDTQNFRDVYGNPFIEAPPFFQGPMIAEVGSVGSVVMIEREVFSRVRFQPSKNREDGSFVKFCTDARAAGHSCWVTRELCAVSPVMWAPPSRGER